MSQWKSANTLHWDILSPKKCTSAHKESGSQQEITAVIDSTLLSIFNKVKQKYPLNHPFTQSSATACSVCACVNRTTPVWALLLLMMALTSAVCGWLCGRRRLPNEPVCRKEKKYPSCQESNSAIRFYSSGSRWAPCDAGRGCANSIFWPRQHWLEIHTVNISKG